MKQSAAQARATQKWEKNNYYKVMLRFPKQDEDQIKAAAGDSINRFILDAVYEKIRTHQDAPGRPETASGSAADTETAQTPERSSGPENGPEKITLEVGPEIMQELRTYGNPAEIAAAGLRAIIEEYRAGLR